MPFYVNLATLSVFKAYTSLLTDQILCEPQLKLHVLTLLAAQGLVTLKQ